MISPGSSLSRGSSGMASDMPPLPQCLPLDPISLGSLGNNKYKRSGELRRVLGVPLGSMSEENSFVLSYPKPPPPLATEELKHYKESVHDASRKARDRAKMFRESLLKLDKYREALSSKKGQRSDLALNERSNGASVGKIGSPIQRSPHEIMTQRLEDKAKSVGLNKRVRTSMADMRVEGRPAMPSRQQLLAEKGADILQDVGAATVRFEEKNRRLSAGGEGWETKNKKKRSVGVVGGRSINGDRDIKRAMLPKVNTESKLRLPCDTQGFRSKYSPGMGAINKLDGSSDTSISDTSVALRNEMENGSVSRDRMALLEPKIVTKGSNKPNVHEDALASTPNTVVTAKVSRAPRTGSIMLLDSSLKAHSSSACVQGLEQPANLNKASVPGVAESQKRQMSAGSSPHAMAQWVGQRPHKNARTRRANVVAPVSSHDEGQISSQGFSASDISVRTSVGTSRSAVASTLDDIASKVKREVESITSTFGLSESEESGAGENKMKDKVTDSGEVTLTAAQKTGAFLLPGRKNKLTTNGNGDGVRRQGRSGRDSSSSRPGFPPVREKLENLPMTKPMPSVKPASERNKSKTGRPPSKKSKDQRALSRIGPMLNGSSLDFTVESDDREELFVAAKSARNASDLACSSPFWKEMESIFASNSSKDVAYLKQQLSFAEELDESLSQILGVGYNALAVLEHKGLCGNSGERLCDNPNQDSIKMVSLSSRVDMGKLEKCAPLYQRVLSALIEEDESEEFYIHGEGKNLSLHDASDDSHCGSCNLIDFETKDRDRIESEAESKVNFQSQKSCFLDRISCNNKSVAGNAFRNPSMSSSFHGPEQWLVDDESSHSDIVHVSEISSTDLVQPHVRESSVPCLTSNNQYQQMSLEDRLLLELQSIGLCPETLPDLAEEEVINKDIIRLKEGLYLQMGQKRRKLGKIDKALQKGKQDERKNLEKVAMDQLVEMAYRKRLASRGNSNSKGAMRKASRQVALAFVKRTLARCKKFEDTGSSCFSEPSLQDAMFSTPLCNNDAKSADGVGSGTASNTCNEVTNHHPEARGSGVVSSTLERHDSFSDNIGRGKRREVLIDDVIGSASSRVTSTLDSSILGGVKGKRSDRERDQSKDNLRSNVASGGVRSSLDNIKSERKTKPKPKQKNNQVSTSVNGHHGSSNGVANGGNKVDRGVRSTSLGNVPNDASRGDELSSLQLPELDTIGLGEPQDIALWLNIDEDGLQGHDSVGLDIPMDDLSELNMLM